MKRLLGTVLCTGLIVSSLLGQKVDDPDPVVAAISVSVTASGAPVTDLGSDDFTVTEYGASAGVERIETPDAPPNVVVVVDTSPGNDLSPAWVRETLSLLLERLDPGTKVALIEAQSPVPEFLALTDDVTTVRDRLDRLEATGRPTNRIYDRVVDAFLMLLDEGTPRGAVVVLTDGIDVGSDRGEDSFLRAIRVAGMPMYVLATDNAEGYSGGLGARAESVPGGERFRAALSTLAGQSAEFYQTLRDRWRERAVSSGGAFFDVGGDENGDRRAVDELAAHLNATYTLYFFSRGPIPDADHTPIEVGVVRAGLDVVAPDGIWWPGP